MLQLAVILCREVRDLKSQVNTQVSQPVSQNMQEIQRERDTIKADRGRLLARVSQLERDVSRMEAVERQKSSAVSQNAMNCEWSFSTHVIVSYLDMYLICVLHIPWH